MADIPMGATTGAAAEVRSASRLLFIDNIRWSMIILVLSMHACDTYSPFGNWYYTDRQATGLGTKLFFGVYQSFLQAFFMAVLFFIAGYFSAAALIERASRNSSVTGSSGLDCRPCFTCS